MLRKTGKRVKSRLSRLFSRRTKGDHPPHSSVDQDSSHDPPPGTNSLRHLASELSASNDSFPSMPDPDRRNVIYGALSDTNSIRLLVLEPGQNDDPLICSLQESSLDDCPPFEAISYVWGSPHRTYPISCDSKYLWITPNLEDALRRVRLPHETRCLWADSICINQDDINEQGGQVSLMGSIYSEAQRVLICLGPDDVGCAPRAVSLIKEVNQMVEAQFRKTKFRPNRFPYPDENDPLLVDERWPFVRRMVTRPWFSRGWVVQEAGLAREAMILWGGVECPWFVLLRAIIWLELRGGYLWDQATVSHLHQEGYNLRFNHEASALNPDRRDILVPELLAQLHSARWLKFSDPRDRIYAFLNLPSWSDSKMVSMYPNYNMSFLDVYLEFAKNYISETQDPTLMHYIEHDEESILDPIPSWVPRWDINYNAILSKFVADPVFSSKGRPIPPRIMQPGNILRLRGVVYDRVEFVSTTLTGDVSIDDMGALINKVISSGNDEVRKYGRSKAAHVKSIVITMGQGVYPAGLDRNGIDRNERAYIRRLQLVDTLGDIQGGVEPEASTKNTTPDERNPAEEGDPHLLHGHIAGYCGGMRLFVTEKGYYGYAQGVVKRGDYCSIIFGAKRPFLLRMTESAQHHKSQYKAVGMAWILGEDELCFGSSGPKEWLQYGAEEVDIDIC
jgi:hypothetical protein